MIAKMITPALVGLILAIGCLFGGGQAALAGALRSNISAVSFPTSPFGNTLMTVTQISPSLESEVNQFLISIPSGYYTVATAAGLKSLLKTSQAMLIDVREPAEYHLGHIPNAINLPLRTLVQNLEHIPRDRPVILYCSTGYRSSMGVMTLHLLGYDQVQGFPPSFAGWQATEKS